ncbi:MAG: DUF3038 domain-containing protein [Cyanobacterium sp. T60_A2020_053]|nr:DUF3038 domain-containing protein [Cyanobacterium sp. T60_A2020_053]
MMNENPAPSTPSPLEYNLSLIYLGILSLEIETRLNVIPQNKTDLNFVVDNVIKLLKKNQELLYRVVSLWEQIETLQSDQEYYGTIKDYIENFKESVENYEKFKLNLPSDKIKDIALNTLTELLFYSGISGEKLLRNKLENLLPQG